MTTVSPVAQERLMRYVIVREHDDGCKDRSVVARLDYAAGVLAISCVGYGATRHEAIADLMGRLRPIYTVLGIDREVP